VGGNQGKSLIYSLLNWQTNIRTYWLSPWKEWSKQWYYSSAGLGPSYTHFGVGVNQFCSILKSWVNFQGQNFAFLLQSPAGFPKITILVTQQKLLKPSNWLCTWNIQYFSSQMGYFLKIFRSPGQIFMILCYRVPVKFYHYFFFLFTVLYSVCVHYNFYFFSFFFFSFESHQSR